MKPINPLESWCSYQGGTDENSNNSNNNNNGCHFLLLLSPGPELKHFSQFIVKSSQQPGISVIIVSI